MLWNMFSGCRCEAATTGVPSLARQRGGADAEPERELDVEHVGAAQHRLEGRARGPGEDEAHLAHHLAEGRDGELRQADQPLAARAAGDDGDVVALAQRLDEALRGDDAAGLDALEEVDGVGDVEAAGGGHGARQDTRNPQPRGRGNGSSAGTRRSRSAQAGWRASMRRSIHGTLTKAKSAVMASGPATVQPQPRPARRPGRRGRAPTRRAPRRGSWGGATAPRGRCRARLPDRAGRPGSGAAAGRRSPRWRWRRR